jgi:hypothetical protein
MSRLYDDVRTGALRITLVVGPPRGACTALSLAIAQSPDIALYVHEPFANKYENVRSASRGTKILNTQFRRLKTRRSRRLGVPHHILIKETCNHLVQKHFRRLCSVSDSVVIVVRWPLIQLRSVLRTCKWVYSGCPDAFRFSLCDFTEEDREDIIRNGDLLTYFTSPWRALKRQAVALEGGVIRSDGTPARWIAIEADIAQANAQDVLRSTAAHLDLSFSSQMIAGWRRDKVRNIHADAWSAHTARARRLYRLKHRAPALDEFPYQWHSRIYNVLATYVAVIASPNMVRPNRVTELTRLFQMKVRSGLTFAEARPGTCYALAATLPGELEEAHRLRLALRRKFWTEYPIFNMVDQIVYDMRH